MRLRERLMSVVDRLVSVLPGPPDEHLRAPYPDPYAPGLSESEREARLELMRKSLEKEGRGGER
jgi:hypothetical protein